MSSEAGRETTNNYRFQYMYVALLAMQMYNRKNNFVELICEYENDIAAKDKDGRFTSYQITRSDYARTIPKDKTIKSLRHFLELCKDRRYAKFFLISSQERVASTIKASDISEIINNCMNIPILETEDKNVVREQTLQEHDNSLINQCIKEANENEEKIASTALTFLEHLGIKMKIYHSRKLLSFLRKCIYDEAKIGYLNFYLDITRCMLHTSTTVDKDYTLLNYVKKIIKGRSWT